MLKEKAGQYYFAQDKSCAEAILLAANEAYHLGMTEEATKLFAGFRTGSRILGRCCEARPRSVRAGRCR